MATYREISLFIKEKYGYTREHAKAEVEKRLKEFEASTK